MLDILRKEIKYVIPRERFLRLQQMLDCLMTRDEHGFHGSYMVRSQYYDSIRDTDLHDNLDGVMEKRKIRVRIYSPDAKTAKLEYKCKSNTDGRKMWLEITREEAIELENHRYECLLQRKEELALFLYSKMRTNIYSPKTIVEYNRIAYANPVSDVRITFDTEVRGTEVPYGLFEHSLPYIPLIKPDLGILEIKYNSFLSAPIKQLVEEIDNVAEASSKYSKARLLLI